MSRLRRWHVIVLVLATGRVIHEIQAAPEPPNAVRATVIGRQWWWEIRYPKLGIVTANELHVPAGDDGPPTIVGLEPHGLSRAGRRRDREALHHRVRQRVQ